MDAGSTPVFWPAPALPRVMLNNRCRNELRRQTVVSFCYSCLSVLPRGLCPPPGRGFPVLLSLCPVPLSSWAASVSCCGSLVLQRLDINLHAEAPHSCSSFDLPCYLPRSAQSVLRMVGGLDVYSVMKPGNQHHILVIGKHVMGDAHYGKLIALHLSRHQRPCSCLTVVALGLRVEVPQPQLAAECIYDEAVCDYLAFRAAAGPYEFLKQRNPGETFGVREGLSDLPHTPSEEHSVYRPFDLTLAMT